MHQVKSLKARTKSCVSFRKKRYFLTFSLIGITTFALLKSLVYVNNFRDTWTFNIFPVKEERVLCSFPRLNPRNPAIDRYFHQVPALECEQDENWICINGSYVGLCESFARENPQGVVSCNYSFIDRKDDQANHVTHTLLNVTSTIKLVSDFFQVKCSMRTGNVTKTWRNLMCGIADRGEETTKEKDFPASSMGLNVLVFGFDSLSHMTFMRKLPKTYDYIKHQLGAVVLNGYNIVGDGTPQALIPIFTGSTEPELPETRKRMGKKATFVNAYPFVWNDYRDNGYVTAYTEDGASFGTFTYRLKGFDAQPTDHYGRPFYLELDKVASEHRKLCLAGTPRHKVFFKYVEDFFDHYAKRPKFFFGFHSELSHDDYNLIGLADNDVVTFLQSLKNKGHLDNTLLLLMCDHGHRFATLRETQQGKQEERLPFFSFIFPPGFEEKYPKEWHNIHRNVDRLTTPFDIYPTLRDVLFYHNKNSSHSSGSKGKHFKRSISLFDEIPASRTCEDADIEAHWCTCLQTEVIPVTEPIAEKVANAFVTFLNNMTSPFRPLCHLLQLETIVRLEKYVPHSDLLKYKKNSDYDGFVGDFSDNTKISQVTYQIKLVTTPGDGHFEVTLLHNVDTDQFIISERSISRVNMYGSTSHCIAQTQHHLLKYCYCHQQLKTPENNG